MHRPSGGVGPATGAVMVTVDLSRTGESALAAGDPVPGLLLVFSSGERRLWPVAVGTGEVIIGRESMPGLTDGYLSRRHARVVFDGAHWGVTDLGSRNGTAVDGEVLEGERRYASPRALRLGETVFAFTPDVRPFSNQEIHESDSLVLGPALRAAWAQIELAARTGAVLHIRGESGTGKELAARAFHDLGPRPQGPFVAVNCAAIPENLAERLLFGARKGAFSGADADAEGYIQAADGGTLFLDEIGEIPLALQAKLLRVLETQEVLPLGATRARRVDVRTCTATHQDLERLASEGRFRPDLYYRIGRPRIDLPPLRERPEEIPALVARELRRADPACSAAASLIEACMLRPWPGNVRELLVEVRQAIQAARSEGSEVVTAQHLAPAAGAAWRSDAEADRPPPPMDSPASPPVSEMPPREQIEEALRQQRGQVASAARTLGIPRIRLRRWLERNGIDPSRYAGDDEPSA
jgi:transcriptional regulator with GAF, ATPase, and Fis domain